MFKDVLSRAQRGVTAYTAMLLIFYALTELKGGAIVDSRTVTHYLYNKKQDPKYKKLLQDIIIRNNGDSITSLDIDNVFTQLITFGGLTNFGWRYIITLDDEGRDKFYKNITDTYGAEYIELAQDIVKDWK